MKYLRFFEEKYAEYLQARAVVEGDYSRRMTKWALLMVPALFLAFGILAGLEIWGDMGYILGNFMLMLLASFAVLTPRCIAGERRSRTERLTCELSAQFMAETLEETLGSCTIGEVRYLVMQAEVDAAAKVERNQRQAWLKKGEEFLLHRVRITEKDADDNTYTKFDGTVFSVPVDPAVWGTRDNRKAYKELAGTWGEMLRIDGRKPQFSLDRIDGKLWLSAGYPRLKLGDKDIPWRDLELWQAHCGKEALLVKEIRDDLHRIAREVAM